MATEKDLARYKQNYETLIKEGVDKSWLDANYGQAIENKSRGEIVNAWNSYKTVQTDARTPDFLKNDPSFQALPPDLKEIAIYNYEVQKSNDQQKADKLSKALEMATQQADPYWKSILLIAQDEVLRGFEQAQGDFESSIQRQQRIMENIQKDLTYNKDFLSLEQQTELANISRQYEYNTENLVQGAANAGLTFSTKRKIAEKRLAEENQGMVESSQRQYNKQLRDLQESASRGTTETQQEIEDLQRRMGDYTTNLGRSAEKYLGTDNLPSLPGYQALGNVTGDMYEEKVKDIEARKQGIYGELNQSSLNF